MYVNQKLWGWPQLTCSVARYARGTLYRTHLRTKRIILGVNSLLCVFVYDFDNQNDGRIGTCEYAARIARGLYKFYQWCRTFPFHLQTIPLRLHPPPERSLPRLESRIHPGMVEDHFVQGCLRAPQWNDHDLLHRRKVLVNLVPVESQYPVLFFFFFFCGNMGKNTGLVEMTKQPKIEDVFCGIN